MPPDARSAGYRWLMGSGGGRDMTVQVEVDSRDELGRSGQ